ncbi:MAG TPA: methyltransferase [Acidimicrobiales bacterium]|jgi:hypothetical protein|nr:methyltransferase [Acidimicrobiales bacterium]
MSARDALGMPVPPVAAVKGATALRRLLGRADDRATAPFQLVLERLFGVIDTKTLFAVVELGVPDVLADGPMRAADIAGRVGADADALERVLRYLTTRGLFRRRRGGRYANNAATDLLRAGHPFSWRDWAMFLGSDWNTRIWDHLPARVRGEGDATTLAHGSDFFTYVNSVNPAAGEAFNGGQAAGSRVQGALFAEHAPLTGVQSLCDVAGGTGSVLTAVLRAHPGMTGVVFDLPGLEDGAGRTFRAGGVDQRAGFTAGDFFVPGSVPSGYDLYTLFAITHDWGDDDCVRILANVRAALPDRGRVMVVDGVLPRHGGRDFVTATDMMMLAYTAAGRERALPELEAVFGRAGLVLRRRTTLPSLFDVFELTR